MNRTVVHDSFVIERSFSASPGRVFRAFAGPAAKAAWFGHEFEEVGTPGGPDRTMEFKVGGRELLRGKAPGGNQIFTFDA